MDVLYAFFSSFMNIGVSSEPDPAKRAYIQYFNFDLLGYLAFAVLAVPVVYMLPAEVRLGLHMLSLVYILLISICFYLNRQGYHVLSSVVINIGLLAAVTYENIQLGSESHVYLFIISICMTPLFMVHQRKWIAYALMLLGITLFIILSNELLLTRYSANANPAVVHFFRTAVNILIIPVTTMRFLFIFGLNDEYITKLEQQRSYLRKVIDLIPNFIFAKNRKGEFTLVNEAVAKTYGTSVSNLLGKADSDFNPNYKEVAHFRGDDLEVMDSKQSKFIPLEEITDATTGKKKYLQTVKTPFLNEDGEATELLGVSTDITERIETQTQMQQMQETLRQKNDQLEKYIESNLQLENFAYIASHDLREPLRSIIGYSQLLERRYGHLFDSEGHEYIGHLINSTKSMNNLITDLLLFSRVNTDSINYQTVMLEQIAYIVRENLRSTITDTHAVIKWHNMPDEINADKSRMIQLFQNLLSNAIKFHKPGVPPQININYSHVNGLHQFAVSDNGIGVEPEYQKKIFQIFHRLHNRSQYEGSGIGLATCHKIVEQHNGTIWVESVPDQGSTFIFTIGT